MIREGDQPGAVFTMARWGLLGHGMIARKGGTKPLNVMAETVAENLMFGSVYKARRALMPSDGFFEWEAVKSGKAKQPYAVAMKDGAPFCAGGPV